MRIKLSNGKQRELILSAKGDKTWPQLAKKLGLNDVYLRNELRHEKRLMSEDVYNLLCKLSGNDYSFFIDEKMRDTWGKSLGGKNSIGKTKKISIPKESKKFAEFYGIMLGDGNSNRTKGYKLGSYAIRIVGDKNLDKEYHLDYVKLIIENLFDVKVRAGSFKGKGSRFLEVHSKKLVDFLESKGFKPGNKIKNKLRIPNWIRKNKSFLRVCLRGLYDTDGGMYKLNNQNSFQIAFTNHNFDLLKDVRNSLISLGIVPSKIVSGRRVYITKKSELRKFLKLVGFRNSRHLNKVKMFKIAP